MRACGRQRTWLSAATTISLGMLITGCGAAQDSEPDAPPSAAIPSLPPRDSQPTPDSLPSDAQEPGGGVVDGGPSSGLAAARSVLETYYAAINERRFDDAYYLWSDSGRASLQTLDEFREGYALTNAVGIEVGEGTMEGAAGSRYAEFPVLIDATETDGTTQRFTGSYVLRRSVVDGATAEQRAWRIYSAEVNQVE